MTDIALVWDTANGRADFAMNAAGTDLLMDDTPETAVIISLFSHRLLDASDINPDGTTDRGGWWGDSPDPNGPDIAGGLDLTGSRLRLLVRSLQTQETLRRAETYVKESLAWMITDGVATTITASAVFPARPAHALEMTISISLTGGTVWSKAFGWAA